MSKKVLLVKCLNPEKRDVYAFRQIPLGIAYLAAVIKDFCDLEVFDMLVDDGLLEKIRRDKPDIIGLSIFSVDFIFTERLIEIIKKLSPSSLIVAGGAHATVEPIETLRAGADLVVCGEGEQSIQAIVEALNGDQMNRNEIPGISYFDSNQIGGVCHNPAACEDDIDNFPMPGTYYWHQPEKHGISFDKRTLLANFSIDILPSQLGLRFDYISNEEVEAVIQEMIRRLQQAGYKRPGELSSYDLKSKVVNTYLDRGRLPVLPSKT